MIAWFVRHPVAANLLMALICILGLSTVLADVSPNVRTNCTLFGFQRPHETSANLSRAAGVRREHRHFGGAHEAPPNRICTVTSGCEDSQEDARTPSAGCRSGAEHMAWSPRTGSLLSSGTNQARVSRRCGRLPENGSRLDLFPTRPVCAAAELTPPRRRVRPDAAFTE